MRQRGFTLVELLVVFAIVALLAGLTPIAFDKMRESAQYRDALRSMLSDMRTARSRAITHGGDVRFWINVNQRSYGLDGQLPHVLPPPLEMRAIVASNEIEPDGTAAILFLPAGGATGGSVELTRPSGAGTRLRVDWLSGQVTQEALLP